LPAITVYLFYEIDDSSYTLQEMLSFNVGIFHFFLNL